MTAKILSIPPKSRTFSHRGQKVRLVYHPEDGAWSWYVRAVIPLEFRGAVRSEPAAEAAAKEKINILMGDKV